MEIRYDIPRAPKSKQKHDYSPTHTRKVRIQIKQQSANNSP